MEKFERMYINDVMKKASETDEVYRNDKYQVNLKHLEGGITWLSIKSVDKQPIHDWRDLQLIKNMLCGPEREGCEIYPRESRLVDTSNQYHIYVLPEGQEFPFGFDDRMIVSSNGRNSVQRPFNDDELPEDAMTGEEVDKLDDEYIEKIRKGDIK